MLFERRTRAFATPFAVARALADRENVTVCWTEHGRRAWVGCGCEPAVTGLDPEPGLVACTDAELGGVPRWFGILPYEARRDLERGSSPDPRPSPLLSSALWRRYRAWVEVGDTSRVVGDDESAVRELAQWVDRSLPSEAARLELAEPIEPALVHQRRIERALELIASGEIYEVNLARRMRFRTQGRPWELLAELGRAGLPAYSLALDWPELAIVATSPELFLAQDAKGLVWTSPIKGTRPRDPDPITDLALAAELDKDPKEIAELTMIIDVERNDLGRLALPGSVRLREPPRLEAYASVHHRVATIEAKLREGVTRHELLNAMLPSGSVSGAPKVRAMEIIAELEAHRRGLYTGAFGVIRHDGSLELGMAIRTLSIAGGHAEYFSGGGIVADSVPEREVEETLWKARPYLALAGQSPR